MAGWPSRMLMATAVAIVAAAPAFAGSGSGSGGGDSRGCGSAPASFPEGYPLPADITLDRNTLTPGQSTGGTITLDRPALSGGTPAYLYPPPVNVTLSPRCVLIPAGQMTGRFTLSLGSTLRAPQSFWIYVSFDVNFMQTSDMAAVFVEPPATAPPPPPPPPAGEPATSADTVAVTRAEWSRSRRRLTVSATSTSTTARLTAHRTSTGAAIGALRHDGGGRYSGTFTNIATSPGQITVRSSLGGSASATVVTR